MPFCAVPSGKPPGMEPPPLLAGAASHCGTAGVGVWGGGCSLRQVKSPSPPRPAPGGTGLGAGGGRLRSPGSCSGKGSGPLALFSAFTSSLLGNEEQRGGSGPPQGQAEAEAVFAARRDNRGTSLGVRNVRSKKSSLLSSLPRRCPASLQVLPCQALDPRGRNCPPGDPRLPPQHRWLPTASFHFQPSTKNCHFHLVSKIRALCLCKRPATAARDGGNCSAEEANERKQRIALERRRL